ncbi:MAG: dTDP-glucose 4,6-dehydratase [Neisseriaceae bacterium]|nr:dTDP-glucose 4,6-dehydratase [Neisseriaceae bacterium]MBP6863442.1 dTDP-glucose 4,6-dehydratase [Neisseriaceae bacterium]
MDTPYYFVTGGAGFIGSHVVRFLLTHTQASVVNIDCLSYASRPQALADLANHPRYLFSQTDINDGAALTELFQRHQPQAVLHLAAESHVDNAIHSPEAFIYSNVQGTFSLLEATRLYWQGLEGAEQAAFRFLHVSTDEVFGDLPFGADPLTEDAPYRPSNPYSASKAASDHLVNAWHRTYGLPTLMTHCTNNFGPWQHPEKLIPHMLSCALKEAPLPLYGDGLNSRDWLYVEDHVQALWAVLQGGQIGTSYHISAQQESSNLALVTQLCQQLDALKPRANGQSYTDLITFVTDRPGHDVRYALNADRLKDTLNWHIKVDFNTRLRETVSEYLAKEHP